MDRTAHPAVQRICLSLPEVTERLSHGEPTWFVRDKKTFVTSDTDHHGSGHIAIWCAAPPGVQEAMVARDPERFFRPPYVGHRGWLGVRVDVDIDEDELREIIEDAYRMVAPASLVKQLDAE
jgi:hypothetical protein